MHVCWAIKHLESWQRRVCGTSFTTIRSSFVGIPRVIFINRMTVHRGCIGVIKRKRKSILLVRCSFMRVVEVQYRVPHVASRRLHGVGVSEVADVHRNCRSCTRSTRAVADWSTRVLFIDQIQNVPIPTTGAKRVSVSLISIDI